MNGYTFLVKTAVSVPDEVFDEADRLASLQGVSRSELYTRALRSYLADHLPDEVTEQLDAVVAEENGTDLAAVVSEDLIDPGRWEW